MKNLKKILSLVLVVAMACSMLVVASAKDYETFTDAADITEKYTEAVDVISALNIFAGDDTGALNPQGTFTRAQAAKIVTYMSIGNTAAESLSATGGYFKDVPATHWASKYIAYAYNAGILSGDGDGNFRPDDAVTGAEVAKLMNTVLGYGKMGEYVGKSWQLNAISHGVSRGLITGNADMTAPATREEVIQYVFNTIRPDGKNNYMVEYSSIIGNYVKADGSGGTQASQNNKTTIGYYIFNLSRSPRVDLTDGTPSHFWRKGSVELTGIYPNGDPAVVSTNGVAIEGTKGLLKTNNIENAAGTTNGNGFDVYINGIEIEGTYAQTMAAAEKSAAKVGAKVSIYTAYNSKTLQTEVTHIAVIDKTVAKVLAAPSYKDGVMKSIAGLPSPGTSNVYIGDSELAKDDIVLYYTDGNGDIHVNKAEYVEGQLTRYTPNTSNIKRLDAITFAGNSYYIAGLDGTLTDLLYNNSGVRPGCQVSSGNFNTDAVIYLDDFGNVVYLQVGAIVKNYVYAYSFSNDGFVGSTAAVRAKLVKTDGTVITAPVKTSTADLNAAGKGIITTGENREWYSFVESDGTYTLSRVDTVKPHATDPQGFATSYSATGGETIISKNTNFYSGMTFLDGHTVPNVISIYGDATTTFIYLNAAKGTTKTYTGINSLAKATLLNTDKVSVIVSAKGGRAAQYVVIETSVVPEGAATVAYFTQVNPYEEVPNADYNYYNTGVILNGVLQEDVIVTDWSVKATGLYSVVKGDDGVYSLDKTNDPNGKAGIVQTGILNTTGDVFRDLALKSGSKAGPIAHNTSIALYTLHNGPVKVDASYFANNTALYYDYTIATQAASGTTPETVTHIYATPLDTTKGTITGLADSHATKGIGFYMNGNTSVVYYAGSAKLPATGVFTPVNGAAVEFWYDANNVVRVVISNTGTLIALNTAAQNLQNVTATGTGVGNNGIPTTLDRTDSGSLLALEAAIKAYYGGVSGYTASAAAFATPAANGTNVVINVTVTLTDGFNTASKVVAVTVPTVNSAKQDAIDAADLKIDAAKTAIGTGMTQAALETANSDSPDDYDITLSSPAAASDAAALTAGVQAYVADAMTTLSNGVTATVTLKTDMTTVATGSASIVYNVELVLAPGATVNYDYTVSAVAVA